MSTLQLHEYIAALKLRSENIHVVDMFISPLRKVAPAIVIANPRVTSPQQAKASGKAVIFLHGNIHPPEPEAAEALLMVARDLAAGKRKHLLDNQIVVIAPIFNVDGTDTFVTQDGVNRQRDAIHPRRSRKRGGARPQSRRREAADVGGQRALSRSSTRGIRFSFSMAIS